MQTAAKESLVKFDAITFLSCRKKLFPLSEASNSRWFYGD